MLGFFDGGSVGGGGSGGTGCMCVYVCSCMCVCVHMSYMVTSYKCL